MEDIIKEYTNGEVTVVWKPAQCIHSKLCWTNLRTVFDPRRRPWVDMTAADTETIKKQVELCPSGALSYFMNAGGAADDVAETVDERAVEIMPNGPLMVYGNLIVKHADGRVEEKHKVTAFCRCGASANKPYCDGSHMKTGFKDSNN